MPGATTIPQDKVVEMGREFQRRHPTWQQPWVQLEFFQKVKICTLRNPFWSIRKDQYWRWESLLKEMPKTVGEVYGQTSQEGEVINPSQVSDHPELVDINRKKAGEPVWSFLSRELWERSILER